MMDNAWIWCVPCSQYFLCYGILLYYSSCCQPNDQPRLPRDSMVFPMTKGTTEAVNRFIFCFKVAKRHTISCPLSLSLRWRARQGNSLAPASSADYILEAVKRHFNSGWLEVLIIIEVGKHRSFVNTVPYRISSDSFQQRPILITSVIQCTAQSVEIPNCFLLHPSQ